MPLRCIIHNLPVYGYGHEGEHRGRDSAWCNELAELAVGSPEGPITAHHVERVKERVEDSYKGIGHGQIDQEVVRHRAHALVGQDYPNHNDIAPCSHEDHAGKGHHVDELDVPGRDERVAVILSIRRHIGAIRRLPQATLVGDGAKVQEVRVAANVSGSATASGGHSE